MRIKEVLTLAAFAFSAFPTHAQEAVIERGKAIYVDHCAICHGDDGKGGGDLGGFVTLTQLNQNSRRYPRSSSHYFEPFSECPGAGLMESSAGDQMAL